MKRPIVAAAILAAAVVTGLMLHAQTAPATGAAANNGAGSGAAGWLPPNEMGAQGNGPVAKARVEKSPRHGEWVDVKIAGNEKPLKTWVVYPERADKAPVVLVIMEIYGMTDWVRATTDQLAADGFIAVAPDFMSLKPAGTAVNAVQAPEVVTDLNAARDWALAQPSANGKSASIGFCWGGGMSFQYAIAQPKLNAAAVFYGTPPQANGTPDEAALGKITCPIAGFFGGADARVTSMVAPTQAAMKKINKSYDAHVYDGAGHGFMRQQDGPQNAAGANLKAASGAWPVVVKFLTDNTKP